VIPAFLVAHPFQFAWISFIKSRSCRTLLLLFFSLLSPLPIAVYAEVLPEEYRKTPLKQDILSGIDLLYDLEFQEAEKVFYKVVERKPDHPIGHFYVAMVSWSKLSSGFWTQDVMREYTDRIDKTIAVARKAIGSGRGDSFTHFYLGGALGFKGRFELMQRNWFSAADLAWEAIQALNTCVEMDPENKDVLLGLGIYDYYTAKLSGALKWLTYLFLHKGTKEDGLQKLHRAAEEAIYSGIESKSMLIHIYIYLEEEYSKALPLVLDLGARFKNDPRYKFFEGIIYSRLGMDGELINTVEFMRQRSRKETSATKSAWWVRQAFYLEASHSLWLEQYSLARLKLDAVLAHQDPLTDPDMIAWPLLKKGMSFDFEGERQIALEYYNQVLALDNGAGAQFLASKFSKSPPKNRDRFLGY
jgi:tetratricopeptide (TPR) repeat protein